MSAKKTVETLKEDVAFLADRLALALTLQDRELYRAIVVLPEREEDRELFRQDEQLGRRYDVELTTVRQVLTLDRKRRA